MQKHNGRYSVYGNELSKKQSRKTDKWQRMFVKKFDFDPSESYNLSVVDNTYLGSELGLRNIVRDGNGEPISADNAVVCSTIRMGFGHYRIAMAGASCAQAMGYTPLWMDLLSIPGISTDVINFCNTWYSRFSRTSQRSSWFNTHIWEPVTTGEPSLPLLNAFLNSWIVGWPWRFLKTNVKDYKMSELFAGLFGTLPSDMPILTAHMWNCMGAVAGGMTNVVDMMFDNWPMAFQLTEGAKHAVQTPSGYYGFRAMRGFDEKGRTMKPVPADALHFVGHHVDHELVHNIEDDCAARIARMESGEPRRLMVTMGGAGAQRELFLAILKHCLPLVAEKKVALFLNLGDHASNWEWLKKELGNDIHKVTTHFSWDDTRSYADSIRTGHAEGIHVFLHDNIYHGVYATNYLMRVVDIMITKPSELAFYPVPKIFNARVGGHEMWGAVRGAEVGDSTCETRTIPETLQAIDLMTQEDDLLRMYCDSIVRNKSIGIYDGGYHSVALATGTTFDRSKLKTV
ncbi:DUF6938 domain-containing protein [Spirochaeta africana]|uniref:Uncharacterized protein n=1 Tax=Spirochaeta africana (strain ATCC 700263 / DSM 8902 / Z-7692) TaxID=889378 RepID=H9UHP2_SPIAZ|nr:hypothetical protein [Spirochaeta africana]AFG37035.1 hypothetical protein Spiaf_0946 [Spirochaeta africana DSM 8902]